MTCHARMNGLAIDDGSLTFNLNAQVENLKVIPREHYSGD